MLNCKDATRLASDKLERRLTPWEWMNFLMHIAMCPFCRRFTRQLAWLHELFRRAAKLDDEKLAAIGRRYPIDMDSIARKLPPQSG